MSEFASVAQAAQRLAVSERRVRYLLESGSLDGERLGGRWIVRSDAVRSRAAHSRPAGRPFVPALAWSVLAIADVFLVGGSAEDIAAAFRGLPDPAVRARARNAFAHPRSAQRWQQSLEARAHARRLWVHPGLVDRFSRDLRVSPGGAFAAAAQGLGLNSAKPDRVYVAAQNASSVIGEYRARDDQSGQIELMVIPDAVPEALRAQAPYVSVAVALADLLESDDARERHLAVGRFSELSGMPAGD